MQPSSLVFVAIIAIWAVYLLQHWVRRREHLATARSVDRYSEAMRVLDRRTPGTTRTSAAVTGGAATTQAVLNRPVVTMAASPGSAPAPTTASPMGARPTPATVGLTPLGAGVAKVAGLNGPRLAGMARGIAFLGSLVGAPILFVLALLSRASWSLVLLDLIVLGGSVVLLRRAALARRRRRSTGRPADGRPSGRPSEDRRAAGRAGAAPTAAVTGAMVVAHPRAADVDEATQPIPVEDLPVAMGAAADLAAPDGTWSPVPVPPPTYTLKEKAERPAPAPLEVPRVDVVEPAVHELAEAVRRAANG